MGKEFEIGKVMNEAVKAAGVKHYIFSSLANVKKISNGKWDVPHFTMKALIEDHAREIGIPTVGLGAGCYMQNWLSFFTPAAQPDGSFVFNLPMPDTAYLHLFDIDDIGTAAVTVFNDFDTWVGKTVPLYGEKLHPSDLAKVFTEVTGKKASFNSIPLEVYAKFSFPGAEEMAQMFGWFAEFGYFGPNDDHSLTKKVNSNLTTWKDFVTKTGMGK